MTAKTGKYGCYYFEDLEDGKYKITVKRCKVGGKKIVVINGGTKHNNINFRCRK